MEFLVAAAVVLALAVVPTVLYALFLWWLDRCERDARNMVLVAFLWGAVPAILFTFAAQSLFDVPFSLLGGPGSGTKRDLAGLAVSVTEELFKGLTLLPLLLLSRWRIETPTDGVIYGGLIGFGFASTENLIFFLDGLSRGTDLTPELAFFRAILFGLSHALFTGCTGLGFALARASRRRFVEVALPLLGLAPASLLHVIYDAGPATAETLHWPLLADLPTGWLGVAGLIVIAWVISARDRTRINRYLDEEVQVGTLSQRDYWVIQSCRRRVGERLRALTRGDFSRWLQLGRYYQLATELAFAKQRWIALGREPDSALHIEQLRRELYEMRKQL
ncbi:MAG: PrsW family intramembrane metalloprotease [Anaerolineae bacterium]|jgi:RsiW-degrading membrane proteinase PrsW (M82 family)